MTNRAGMNKPVNSTGKNKSISDRVRQRTFLRSKSRCFRQFKAKVLPKFLKVEARRFYALDKRQAKSFKVSPDLAKHFSEATGISAKDISFVDMAKQGESELAAKFMEKLDTVSIRDFRAFVKKIKMFEEKLDAVIRSNGVNATNSPDVDWGELARAGIQDAQGAFESRQAKGAESSTPVARAWTDSQQQVLKHKQRQQVWLDKHSYSDDESLSSKGSSQSSKSSKSSKLSIGDDGIAKASERYKKRRASKSTPKVSQAAAKKGPVKGRARVEADLKKFSKIGQRRLKKRS